MKVLAMYLPQFHQVKENDEWWGKGFTDWTAVKGAECLYNGHNQPRVPLNNNYYNLLEYETMAWQAELMKKYHIDGMCMYHYWFENGRRILEKPAENLLKWTDISMPFCFCWANETWSRTWKKLSDTNAWSSVYENKNANARGILLKQGYGREKDWEKHFNYLLPFFEDERYIKLDGKPVFVIYKPSKIYSLWSMMDCFSRLAKDNGLPGVYIIGMEKDLSLGLDAVCIRQPYHAMEKCHKKYGGEKSTLSIYSYEELWNTIQAEKISTNPTYFCGFTDHDSSPRMGRNGNITEGSSPQKFYENFKKLYHKSLATGNEFLFINAWNEWGEGMYLEPDKRNGYAYLKSLSDAIIECGNTNEFQELKSNKIYETEDEKGMRIKKLYEWVSSRHDELLNNWMSLRDRNLNLSIYLKKYGYYKIAVYGTGKLGTHVFYELKGEEIEVAFGIDRNSENVKYPVKVYSPEQKFPKVDAVIITVIDKYGEISKLLYEKMNSPMIPLEDIIQELII